MNSGNLNKTSSITEAGFTIIDVIVAILIVSIFLLVSGQAMLLAAYSRVKAQETSEGLLLIQQDLEAVKYKASVLPLDKTKCSATSSTNGYAQALKADITGLNITYTNPVKVGEYKKYNIIRTETESSLSPYNVLILKYEIKPDLPNSKKVAELYTEVIPDAAFDCN